MQAYRDLVEVWNWEKYVILYDGDQSLFKLQDLIKSSVPSKRQVILRKLSANNDFRWGSVFSLTSLLYTMYRYYCLRSGNSYWKYRDILREILRETEFKNILVDCEGRKAELVLKQAQQVGLMNFQYSFILTTLVRPSEYIMHWFFI